MKKRNLLLITILLGCALPLSVFGEGDYGEDTAQSDTGQNGQSADTMGGMDGSDGMDTMDQNGMSELEGMYDPNAVETIEGRIIAVDTSDTVPGYNLWVKTQDESLMVNLGPREFIQQQGVMLDTGDTVTIMGSRVTYKDKPIILAQEIQTLDQSIRLRDEEGTPMWGQGSSPEDMTR